MKTQREAEIKLAELLTEHIETRDAEDLIDMAQSIIKKCGRYDCLFCNSLKEAISNLEEVME